MEWWNELELVMKVLYIMAISSTLVLAIQMILSMSGLGGSEFEVAETDDLSGMEDLGVDGFDSGEASLSPFDINGLNILTLRGVLAFFSIGSWTSIVCRASGLQLWISLLIGLVAGIAIMYILAVIMRWAMRLQSSGNINIRNAIGLTGNVYLSIPGDNSGKGKVSVIIQERLREYDAVTYEDNKIQTGASVRVTDIILPDILVVESL